jgi:hypothetical protein
MLQGAGNRQIFNCMSAFNVTCLMLSREQLRDAAFKTFFSTAKIAPHTVPRLRVRHTEINNRAAKTGGAMQLPTPKNNISVHM